MSTAQFIVVKKVTRDKGNNIITGLEGIRVDKMRSFRLWKKSPEEEEHVEGDMLALYMIGERRQRIGSSDSNDSDSVVKIAESLESFSERVNAIKERSVEGIKRLSGDE